MDTRNPNFIDYDDRIHMRTHAILATRTVDSSSITVCGGHVAFAVVNASDIDTCNSKALSRLPAYGVRSQIFASYAVTAPSTSALTVTRVSTAMRVYQSALQLVHMGFIMQRMEHIRRKSTRVDGKGCKCRPYVFVVINDIDVGTLVCDIWASVNVEAVHCRTIVDAIRILSTRTDFMHPVRIFNRSGPISMRSGSSVAYTSSCSGRIPFLVVTRGRYGIRDQRDTCAVSKLYGIRTRVFATSCARKSAIHDTDPIVTIVNRSLARFVHAFQFVHIGFVMQRVSKIRARMRADGIHCTCRPHVFVMVDGNTEIGAVVNTAWGDISVTCIQITALADIHVYGRSHACDWTHARRTP